MQAYGATVILIHKSYLMHAIHETKTRGAASRSVISYQFFKAIYFNNNHYLCDFSEVQTEGAGKYCIELELPGKLVVHAYMQQKKDNTWYFLDKPKEIGQGMEQVLSNAINEHIMRSVC